MYKDRAIFRISSYFDGQRFQQGDYMLSLQDGRIAGLAPWSVAAEAQQGEYRDLRGSVLVPPLADAHVHAALAPWPLSPEERKGRSEADPFAASLGRLAAAPHSGVGLLRDGGDPSGINLHVRSVLHEKTQCGQAAPHYLVPGPALHSPGRYGSFLGEALADREAMQQMIARLKEKQVDFVKVLPTGIISFKTGLANAAPQFSTDDLRYFVELCHAEGWQVMAHASGSEGIRQSVECGVDFVEHGYFVEPDTLEKMAASNVAWTPTFAPVWVQMQHYLTCGWDVDVRERLTAILAGHRRSLELAVELGVPILTGSDAGAPGVDQIGGIYLELELLQEAGMPVEALLRWSCADTPRRLGVSYNTWEMGTPARFILAPPRVTSDITALLLAPEVMWDGRTLTFQKPTVHAEGALSVAL